MKTALIIVDAQEDLIQPKIDPPVVEQILNIAKTVDLVIASKSIHPADHFSFSEFGPHCVHGTKGSKLQPDISDWSDVIITKVTEDEECYSAFEGGTLRPKESLEAILKEHKITEVWVGGFGHGWDVPQTAFDANALGYTTNVIQSAVARMDVETINKLRTAGVGVLS